MAPPAKALRQVTTTRRRFAQTLLPLLLLASVPGNSVAELQLEAIHVDIDTWPELEALFFPTTAEDIVLPSTPNSGGGNNGDFANAKKGKTHSGLRDPIPPDRQSIVFRLDDKSQQWWDPDRGTTFGQTETPLRLVLVLASTTDIADYYVDVRNALSEFALSLSRDSPSAELHVVTYDQSTRYWSTVKPGAWAQQFRSETLQPAIQPGRNLQGGICKAGEIFSSTPAGTRSILMIISDGLNDEGSVSRSQLPCIPEHTDALARIPWLVMGFSSYGWQDPVQLAAEPHLIALASPLGVYRRVPTPIAARVPPDFSSIFREWLSLIRGSAVLTCRLRDDLAGNVELSFFKNDVRLPSRVSLSMLRESPPNILKSARTEFGLLLLLTTMFATISARLVLRKGGNNHE